jgi:hypothetical protein
MRLAIAVAIVCCAPVQTTAATVQVKGQCTAETVHNLALSCSSDEPCKLFLELAAADEVANRILITGNIHTSSATIESVLLSSEDGGRTWNEAHARIPSAILDNIQFIDFEAGWINGHLLLPSPRDAFLLVTTDGGKTWRRRPVATESRTGIIEQFWFDSRSHGVLAVDRVRGVEGNFRYELWESMTGGESWTVRQVHSEPLKVAKPEREQLWRIRSDSAEQVHVVEKKIGGRWTPVAQFAVLAGECRPVEPEKSDEPPPTAVETPAAETGDAPAPPKPAKKSTLKRSRDN